MLGIEHIYRVGARFAVIYHSDRHQPVCIDIDCDFNQLTGGTTTHGPCNKVEKRLAELALIGDDRRDLGREFVLDLFLCFLGHARRCCARFS